MANKFIDIAKEFVNQNLNEEEEKKGQETNCGTERKKSKWSENRAVFVGKPIDVIEGEPGQVLLVPVEIQNQTKWPWKRGCYLGQFDRNAMSELIIGDIPIDFDVKGLQTFKLSIPVQIPENINLEKGDTFEVALAFIGPKGNSFGQSLYFKVRVIDENMKQEKIFRTAITLTEAGLGTFEECVLALNRFNGDENDACQYLIDKKGSTPSETN